MSIASVSLLQLILITRNMDKIALIPARAGSERVPNKNLLPLNGHPLLAYSITSALACPMISRVIVSTDSEEIASAAMKYGAEVPGLRPKEISQSNSPDILWIQHALQEWIDFLGDEILLILRPTNPLRSTTSISKALDLVCNQKEWDSLRAVRPVKEHPKKMWKLNSKFMEPYLPELNVETGTDSHSSPFQTLEKLLVQDASLEICKIRTILNLNSLSGNKVIPFRMPEYEGFDINYLDDLVYLNYLIREGKIALPSLKPRD